MSSSVPTPSTHPTPPPRVLVYVQDRALAEKHAHTWHPGVAVVHGDIFQCRDAECLVTAGNSFGMMDGGIDGTVNYQFDMIEPRVQTAIAAFPWRWMYNRRLFCTQIRSKHKCLAPGLNFNALISFTSSSADIRRSSSISIAPDIHALTRYRMNILKQSSYISCDIRVMHMRCCYGDICNCRTGGRRDRAAVCNRRRICRNDR